MKSTRKEMPSCVNCTTRETSVFCCLQTEDIAAFSENKGCNLYKKGQQIFSEGANPTGVFCIHEGSVKISKLGIDGKEQIVKLCKIGDIMGYGPMLAGDSYDTSAFALEDSTICYIPKAQFFGAVQGNSKFPIKIMELLSKDVMQMQERLTNWSQKPVLERLAETLLILKETYGTDQDQALNVNISREDLANIVGTATETLIRTLSRLKSDDIIRLKGKKIILQQPHKVVQLANLY